MKKSFLKLLPLFVFGLVLLPYQSQAISGSNMSDVKVEMHVKQGGEWFHAVTKRTDSKGVLEVEGVLPGWCEVELEDSDDEVVGQTFASRLKMLDKDGRPIDHKTDVDMYIDLAGTKTFVTTIETDEDGWIESEGLSPNTKYYLDIDEDDGSSISNKHGAKPRLRVNAKVEDSGWFRAFYDRLDQYGVFEVENVIDGKYKFKYIKDDRSALEPFTLKIRMRDEDKSKITKPTEVNLYAYPDGKNKMMLATLKTDARGWITIPGVLTQMKYKIEVD